MRWKKPPKPKTGDTRIMKRFALWPMKLPSEVPPHEVEYRWFETVYWVEEHMQPYAEKPYWKRRCFWSHAQAMREKINPPPPKPAPDPDPYTEALRRYRMTFPNMGIPSFGKSFSPPLLPDLPNDEDAT